MADAAHRTDVVVLYEVSIDLDAAIQDDYLAWLRPHMGELCALPGFVGARLFEVDQPAAATGRVSLCTHYTLVDTAALAGYLRDHAPRLRAEGEARFGGRFRATRRVLRVIAGA